MSATKPIRVGKEQKEKVEEITEWYDEEWQGRVNQRIVMDFVIDMHYDHLINMEEIEK